MNIQEYISSGALEAYVLGEVSEKEAQEVEQLAEQYPEVREEIAKIELTLEELAFASAVKPDEKVKETIFSQIPDAEPKMTVMEPPVFNYWKYVAAAAVIISVVSSFLAVNYRDQWKQAQNQLSDLIAQNERVAEDYNTVNRKLEQIEQNLAVITDPAYHKIALKGTDNAPDALAHLYWNPSSEDVYLDIRNLKTLSADNQYQLWAIIDGQPVDAGVFNANEKGLLKMREISNASAFAITIEPKGGSTNPTMETMQVIGTVEKG